MVEQRPDWIRYETHPSSKSVPWYKLWEKTETGGYRGSLPVMLVFAVIIMVSFIGVQFSLLIWLAFNLVFWFVVEEVLPPVLYVICLPGILAYRLTHRKNQAPDIDYE